MQQVKLNLDEAMEDLSCRLDQRRQLRARKRSLQSLARVQSALNKWSELLHLDGEDGNVQLDPGLVERAASEFNQLQFCISRCEADLTENHKQVTRNQKKNGNKYLNHCICKRNIFAWIKT